jgi:hypothetical protein
MTLDRLIRAWEASAELHTFSEGASAAEIARFEEAAGWTLAAEWRAFYVYSNGADLFRGNLHILPLLNGGELGSLLDASETLRGHDWPVPDELWVAGGDGEGNKLGLWLPAATLETAPVVELGQTLEPECLAIAATSLAAFLTIRTVYFLQSEYRGSPPAVALDALAVPAELRSLATREGWSAIARWADPALPAGLDNPYAGLDPDEVNNMLGCAADDLPEKED